MQRQFLLIAFNLILLGAVLLFAPQQIPVTLYKLSLITLAALVGFWIDRLIFPYARPDQVLQTIPHSVGAPIIGNRDTVYAACMIRRALIICFAMLAMGLGA